MSYERWCHDTATLADQLPAGHEATQRTNFLAHRIAHLAVPSIVDPLDPGGLITITGGDMDTVNSAGYFFLLDKTTLNTSNTHPSLHGILGAHAYVFHSGDMTFMGLGPYNPETPKGNAMLHIHELEHTIEPREGLYPITLPSQLHTGMIERRAWGRNVSILRLLDGGDVDGYAAKVLDVLPDHALSTTEILADKTLSELFSPPKETFMHEMWEEGGSSRTLLLAMLSSLFIEDQSAGLPVHVIYNQYCQALGGIA